MINTTTRLLAGFGYFSLKTENTLAAGDIGEACPRHVAVEFVGRHQFLFT